jgi:PilZ domain
MSAQPITTASLANRRRARRCQVNGRAKTECRKGLYGLGRNEAVTTLDLSETGARLVVRTALTPGTEVEVQLTGTGVARPLKRPARVVWSLPLADGNHVTGVTFDKALPYADLQRLARG